MEAHRKPWTFYLFASANVLAKYTWDQLVRLGVSWVWLGLEGKQSQYAKLRGTDSHALVRELQAHGIRVLGSSIIGLEEHTPENIDEAIAHAVSHATDFHQFMLYTPLPGTPLHEELSAQRRMLHEGACDLPEIHGQDRFNFEHPHIKDGRETEFLLRAFRRDLEVNGPSVVRMVRTMLQGWQRYKNHPDERVRRRFAWEAKSVANEHVAVVSATVRYYRENPAMRGKFEQLRKDILREFGFRSRVISKFGGVYVSHKLRGEEKRLAKGQTWEPPTYYEHNFEPAPRAHASAGRRCQFVRALRS
jgi:hypothetical protein